MSESTEKVLSQPEATAMAAQPGMQADAFYTEAPEIQGWALQWDTTELRKATLARKMRQLRESSTNPE